MLVELRIKNFAIIDQAHLLFEPGLNVITGETGAGKSILLEALKLVLGARANSQYIREGCDYLEVQALFELENASAIDNQYVDEDQLLVTRKIYRNGKGRVYIGDTLATVSSLATLLRDVIHLCSQNQFLKLLEPDYHREVLDQFAQINHAAYREVFQAWKKTANTIDEIRQRSKQAAIRKVQLQAIIDELSPVGCTSGLRSSLEQQIRALSNSEDFKAVGAEICAIVSEEDGALEKLRIALRRLHKLEQGGSELGALCEALQGAIDNVEEFERRFFRKLEQVEVPEEQLAELRDRLAEVARLERKYKTDDGGLKEIFDDASSEYLTLQEDDLEALEEQESLLREKLQNEAKKISKARKKAARELVKQVHAHLADLNMGDAVLEVAIESTQPNSSGADMVEFLVSTNKGTSAKPLKLIASGGELSRFMLALKSVLREKAGVNVLIFDEVDSGVSGKVARAMGEKLSGLGAQSQVICVTHLPQVSSLADNHILIQKRSADTTQVSVEVLGEKERIEEIARMIAGATVSDAARESAKELMKI